MKKRQSLLLLMSAAILFCYGQDDVETGRPSGSHSLFNIKTNLLYDATATFNLGAEFKTGEKSSLDISANWNPWTFGDNRKGKHILFQPEYRRWTRETFAGHFFGLHAHYAYYNASALPHPPFTEYMNTHRFEGWLAGAGIGYGYRWDFNRRFAMEAEIGVGYAYLDYGKYDCGKCGEKLADETKHYFGPTKAAVSLVYSFGAKKKPAPVYVPPVPVKEPEPTRTIIPYEPRLIASFITPEVEAIKQRSESGKAYLDFAVGRSEIMPAFRDNAAELQKIHNLIKEVRGNPDATITGFTITGYASPEGTYATNLTLSEKRAGALRDHIRAIHGFPYSMFRVEGRGEDWRTLDSLVAESFMSDKYRVLEIIRSTDIFDGREKKLMDLSGGNPYRQMKDELFPQLRRSEYQLHYTVAPFTVEKGKEVFKTRPGSLSLNEMFLIANTYEPGSDAFNEIFETAARIFPASDTANINAAANALNRKDTAAAERYLERVADKDIPAYRNNLGILYWMRGDKEKAAECFARGGVESTRNAAELDKHFNSINQ